MLCTLCTLSLPHGPPPQFFVAAYCYLYPGAALPTRVALGPYHKFLGKATWVAGLATIAVRAGPAMLGVGAGLAVLLGWYLCHNGYI
jgi:hypothetical protein